MAQVWLGTMWCDDIRGPFPNKPHKSTTQVVSNVWEGFALFSEWKNVPREKKRLRGKILSENSE